MKRRALFLYGGWEGHHPKAMAELMASKLEEQQFEVTCEPSLEPLEDAGALSRFDLISPFWTMGTLSNSATKHLVEAVRSGVGLGGLHGGMGDAFRGNLNYEWMVGGHFVAHPSVGEHIVRVVDRGHVITAGLPAEFSYDSEQYYLLVDPAVHRLAELTYEYEGVSCAMPVAWTRPWGKGRVFYSALGHDPEEYLRSPEAMTLAVRGLLWAARVI